MAQGSTKTTAELVSDTIEDSLALLRKELELARIAILEGMASRLKGAGIAALAVVLVLPGLLFVLLGAALWLPFSPQADLVVFGAGLVALAAGGIWWGVRRLKRGDASSAEALDHVKEDVRWVRERVKR